MQFIKLLAMLILSFTIVACEDNNDGKSSGVNNNTPGQLPNDDIDGTPDDDMNKPNEEGDVLSLCCWLKTVRMWSLAMCWMRLELPHARRFGKRPGVRLHMSMWMCGIRIK